MNRHIRRSRLAVVERIVKRSPHLTPEQVAQAAERILRDGPHKRGNI